MRQKLFLLIFAALLIPYTAKAQNYLMVADNTAENDYVPIYGLYADAYLRCQMIYPATMLTSMVGQTVESLTFYLSSPAFDSWGDVTFNVKIMEVAYTSFSSASYTDMTYAETVFCGHLDGMGTTMMIPFSAPYTYSGGNLLVEVSTSYADSLWEPCSFYGINLMGASLQGYSYASVDSATCFLQNFLPKTLFTFEEIYYVIVASSDSLTTHYTTPVNNWYNYSLSETIVTEDEIGGAGTIGSLGYYYYGNTAMMHKDSVNIWIQPTTKVEFVSPNDMEPLFGTAELVYSGPLNCRAGWNSFYLSNPYEYEGSGNIMIIVDDNSGGYDGMTYTFMTFEEESYRSLVWYGDGYNPNPLSTSFSGSKNRYPYRPVMYVGMVDRDNDVSSDTLSYCENAQFETSFGSSNGGTFDWGIMLPSETLVGHNYLKSVMLYVPQGYTGTYTMKIYSGGTVAPGSLAYTQATVFAEGQSGWQEIVLNDTFHITSQNLWITFSTIGINYPMSACGYSGDVNSDWYSLNGSSAWSHLTDYGNNYSWMIRAVTSATVPELPCTVSYYPYTQGFENGMDCWSIIDLDGDSLNWEIVTTPFRRHSGNCAISSSSYDNDAGVLFPDNFLISPAININSNNLELSYYICAQDSNWPAEHIAVYVSTSNNISGITASTPVEEYTLTTPWQGWVKHTVSLASYFGQTVYVAFRHYNSSDMFRVNIDDITIEESTAITYTITAEANDSSMGIVIGGGTYLAGSTATLTAVANSGYYFSHWSNGSSMSTINVTVIGDSTYTAFFEVIDSSYTIYVVSDNTTMGSVSGGGFYSYGDTATLEAFAYNGYHFISWNDGVLANPRQVIVTGNSIYTAYFAIDVVYYTVTAEPSNPTMGNVTGGGLYAAGATATLTANSHVGYHFVEWDDGVTESTRTFTVTDDVSFVAFFASNISTYTITVNSNNPAWGSVSGGGVFPEGTSVTLTAVPNEGYHFEHWQDGDTNANRTINVTADATFTATFVENDLYYTITAVSNDINRGIVSGGGTFQSGEIATLHAEPLSGNYFMQWNDGDTNATRTVVVVSDATYTAFFVPNPAVTYTITATANDQTMGIVTGGGTYTEGSTVTLHAVAFEGYSFTGWNDSNTENPREIMVSSDAEYIAIFMSNQAIASIDDKKVFVYPNPTSDRIDVVLDGSNKEAIIEIIDICGRTVVYTKSNAEKTTIDVSKLPEGSYLIKVTSSSLITLEKLIIE